MCERYVLPDQLAAEREFLPARAWWKFTARFNVAAQQYVPAIRWHQGQSEAAMMRWGLIPASAKEQPTGECATVVDIERVQRCEPYRTPWLNGQRCILPAAGFYAWQLTSRRYRQPYFVRLSDRPVFALAAIWDRWVGEDDDVIESCSIIRLPGNELMLNIANTVRRMPAILQPADYEIWLRGTPVQAGAALRPCAPESMQAHAVSPRINSRVADDAGLIHPVG